MDSESSEDEYFTPEPHRTARKSASTPTPAYSTRRQAARLASRAISASNFDKSMENFNPDMSQRERRKISKKYMPGTTARKPSGAVYDDRGRHIASGTDLCDCLNELCPGCWFECIKCEGTKCGAECRVYRKYVVDSIEFHGYDITIRNPILRN